MFKLLAVLYVQQCFMTTSIQCLTIQKKARRMRIGCNSDPASSLFAEGELFCRLSITIASLCLAIGRRILVLASSGEMNGAGKVRAIHCLV